MRILFDSDALFALYVVGDFHHVKAKETFKRLLKKEADFFVSNLVIQETATVLSYKLGQELALDFLKRFSKTGIKQVFVNQALEAKAWEVFKKQQKKGISFVDCASVVLYKDFKMDKIFSFDRFYKRMKIVVCK